ncbi:uncharacterized protein N0V89_012571 [Didymosphaeria variabile]|uniref:Uncharacterized protein n=1 Tax=Didymosphaeria variabile TaxID=1932322 RepID=A0A9W8XAS9_9PLEO|nr:uncharacterized protein N0V89_012571 [Didymosphaeria variabile]KAJ4344827.1 hypothetical protein N0V89_012571 [Didymosphaeria variabile]
MAPEKHTVSSPHAPDAKRRRDDTKQDPPISPNAAIPVVHRENATIGATIGAHIKPPQSLEEVFALFENRDEDDDEEDDDEDQDVEDDDDDEAAKPVSMSPVVEPPKPVRSFKPPGARDPNAARKDASMNPWRFRKLDYGPLHSKSKNGIPDYTSSKEDRSSMIQHATKTNNLGKNREGQSGDKKDNGSGNPSSIVQTSPNDTDEQRSVEKLVGRSYRLGYDESDSGVNDSDELDNDSGELENVADMTGSLVAPKADSKSSTIEEAAQSTSMEQFAIKVQSDATASNIDIMKQETESSLPSTLTPIIPSAPDWAPFSHKPIYLGEPGHGRFKSRIVFEADTIPHEQHYAETTYGITTSSRMSALEKLMEWRQNFGSKSKDGQLRKAERLIILNEREPSMARNELSRHTDSLMRLGKWLKQFMPDSFVVIKTTIPANAHTKAGRFGAYMEALWQLLANHPFHFFVELEDRSILTMGNASNAHGGMNEELASAINFVNSVEFFRVHGHLMAGGQKPFATMKSKKKQNKTAQSSIDPEREAKNVTAVLPWIPESFARKYYEDCVAFPDQDFGPLEFDQRGTNPDTLMPQEVIRYIASMNRYLFANLGHASQGPPVSMGNSYGSWAI